MSKLLLTPLTLLLLSGCAGAPRYACGVPEGVGCQPVGAIYEASVTGNLERGRAARRSDNGSDKNTAAGTPGADPADTRIVATVQPGDPLLSRPKHIRVWIDRWEDRAGDLHDETYLYLRLDHGTWRLGP